MPVYKRMIVHPLIQLFHSHDPREKAIRIKAVIHIPDSIVVYRLLGPKRGQKNKKNNET